MNYIVPKYQDLKQLGYVPTGKLFEPRDILYSVLTSHYSPYKKVSEQYLLRYKSFRQPTLCFLAGYGYGLDNLQQFGNSTTPVLHSSITLATRNITYAVKHHIEDIDYICCSYKQLDRLSDMLEYTMRQYCIRQ